MILSHCCCCPGLATGGWQFWAAWPGSGVHGRGGRQVRQWQCWQSLWQRSSNHTKPPLTGWTMPSIVTTRSDRVSPRRRWFYLKDLKTKTWPANPRPRQRPCASVGTSWTRTFLSWPRQSPPGALARWTCSIAWPLSDLHDRPGDHGEPWREYPHPERDVHWEKANDWGLWNFWG